MANVLVKPQAERDGRLVILADNTSRMHLIDLTTGEVIEEGRNSGASNGRGATFRFSRPGGSYRNVGLMDDRGNVILTLATAGDRVQFNYSDYNALVATPVSTIEGYRWSNDRNVQAQASGQPSNAEIAQMSPEEYNEYLEQQRQSAASRGESGGGTGSAASAIGAGALVAEQAGVFDGIGVGSTSSAPSGVGVSPSAPVDPGLAFGPGGSPTASPPGTPLSPGGAVDPATGATLSAGEQAIKQATENATQQALASGATPEQAQAIGVQAGEQVASQQGISLTDATTALAWAYQAYQAYNVLSSDMSDEDKARALAKQVGLAVADYWTFGLASVAYGVASQFEEFQKFEREMQPYDPVMEGAGSFGAIWGGSKDAGDFANVLTGGLSGVQANLGREVFGISHPLHRKSTKQYKAERYGNAFNAAATDADKDFVSSAFEGNPNDDQVIDNGPLAGRQYKWDEVKRFATPETVWGEYAFLEAFPDWISGYTEDQRRQIAQAALDEGILESDKGQILASGKRGNLARLRQIGEEIKAGTYEFGKTEEQREAERVQAAEELGVDYTPGQAAQMDEARRQRAIQEREQRAAEEAERQRQAQEAAFAEQQGQGGAPADGGGAGGLVPSDTDVDPPITGFEHTAGADLPPPGADNAALAFNLIQSAPSQVVAQQLAGELFQQERRDPRLNFEQLGAAFQQ